MGPHWAPLLALPLPGKHIEQQTNLMNPYRKTYVAADKALSMDVPTDLKDAIAVDESPCLSVCCRYSISSIVPPTAPSDWLQAEPR
ncbi:hypothetical protein E2C01_019370 [Portunus trituberculatus]|uniref:Uncharacterized protein n=1 Tax=Portunus trituberculatus TaxID=210409 RepID=A0A5B7DY28_PORTR|nr:hypothetical protein [Portunus trituberculatus]